MAGGLETDEQTDSLTKTDAMLLDNKEKPVDRSSIKNRIKSLWIIYFSMYMTMLGRLSLLFKMLSLPLKL